MSGENCENFLLSVADLAFSLGRSEAAVRRYIRSGGLPAVALPSGTYVAERRRVAETLGVSLDVLRRAPTREQAAA